MNYNRITNHYYASFFNMDVDPFIQLIGVKCIESEQRDMVLKGFSKPFPVYLYKDQQKMLLSYSKNIVSQIHQLDLNLNMDIHHIKDQLESIFLTPIQHKILFIFNELNNLETDLNTRILTKDDYEYYLNFFLEIHPDSHPEDWLQDYFNDLCQKEQIVGTFINNQLISVCDSPDMPFLDGLIQHTGIATLPEYRNQGYAKRTAYTAIRHLINKGICPQWECDAHNIGSQRLAKSLGFIQHAEALIIMT